MAIAQSALSSKSVFRAGARRTFRHYRRIYALFFCFWRLYLALVTGASPWEVVVCAAHKALLVLDSTVRWLLHGLPIDRIPDGVAFVVFALLCLGRDCWMILHKEPIIAQLESYMATPLRRIHAPPLFESEDTDDIAPLGDSDLFG